MQTIAALNPADLWRRHPRESAGLGLIALTALVIAGTAGSTLRPAETAAAEALPPTPLAMAYRPLAAEAAFEINRAIPLAAPSDAARPFAAGAANALNRARALDCLTNAIYYEAGQESADGRRGVAQVILNRVRHPAFPASVCGVVYEGSTRLTGCQFTFTCDGSMARAPARASWDRARQTATAALAGSVYAAVGTATHYHADYVVPYWASSLAKTAVVGAHLFYRWQGGWGRPGAFAQAYSAREADPAALRLAALSISRVRAAAVAPVTEVAGVAVKKEEGGKRVRVLFTPQARAAVEAAPRTPYVERVAASNNLRWTLGEETPSNEAPLGAKTAAVDTSTKAN